MRTSSSGFSRRTCGSRSRRRRRSTPQLPTPMSSPCVCQMGQSSRSATWASGPPKSAWTRETGPLASPVTELLGSDALFADLDRISADMDRKAAAMFEEARRMEAHAFARSEPLLIDFAKLPGWRGCAVVSTMSGNHICTRSIQYSSSSDGGSSPVVTRTSGDCGPGRSRSIFSTPRRSVEPVREASPARGE